MAWKDRVSQKLAGECRLKLAAYDPAQCELDWSCEQVALCEVFRLACGDKDLGSCHMGTRME